MEFENIAIIGAGAVGLFYGAKLQQEGFSVEYQSRSSATALQKTPLDIKSIWGDFKLPVKAFESTTEMRPADLVFLSCKALPQIDYKNLITPVLQKDSVIVVLQNGLNNDEKIHELFPSHHIIAASAFTCISRTAANQVNHLDYGPITISPFEQSSNEVTERVLSVIETSGTPCNIIPHHRSLRWEKLLWNIPFNSLSVALGGVNTKDIMQSSAIFSSISELMNETLEIARADNVIISPERVERVIENTREMEPYKTSMLIDYDLKNRMETEAILGEPLRTAQKYGVHTPVLKTVYNIMTFLNENNIQEKS